MLLDTLGLVPIGPSDNDVFGMALLQTIPLLVAEDIKIECVETFKFFSTLTAWRSCFGAGVVGFSAVDCAKALTEVKPTTAMMAVFNGVSVLMV